MARPKKVVRKKVEIAPEAVEEAVEAVREEVRIEDQKAKLQARLEYLQGLREELVNEGVNDIGTLDVITARVIEELRVL